MLKRPSTIIALASTVLTIFAAKAWALETPAHAGSNNAVAIEHADIVLSTPGAKMTAGYLAIWNGTQRQVSVSRVQSDAFASVSLGRTEIVDGIARIQSIDAGLPIPGHSELLMKPGGVYMMLTGPRAELKPGDDVVLQLTFQDGTTTAVKAVVQPMGQQPMDHHHGNDDQGASK